jgi:hypothetical protein
LGSPIAKEKLRKAMVELANCKAPRIDGVVSEFYKKIWDIVEHDYWVNTFNFVASSSNLQIPLCFFLNQIKPNKSKTWGANLNWVMCHNHQVNNEFRIWNRIMSPWKGLVEKMVFCPTPIPYATLNKELWWFTKFEGGKFGFSEESSIRRV